MSVAFCSNCRAVRDVVIDYETGDTICDCGAVLDSHFIEDNPCVGDDSDDSDTVRARENDMILTGSGMLVGDASTDEMSLVAFEAIRDLCMRLDIAKATENRAKEIYAVAVESESPKLGKTKAIVAACVYMASREIRPRSLNEVVAMADGVEKHELVKEENVISEILISKEHPLNMKPYLPEEFMGRFCSKLQIPYCITRAAKVALKRTENIDIGCIPTAKAAALTLLYGQLADNRPNINDVAAVTNLGAATIKKAYNSLHPMLSDIVPLGYVRRNEILSMGLL